MSKTRAANWDKEEKVLLKEVLKEEIHIIECKDTSSNTNTRKKQAWERIVKSFNALNKRPRKQGEIITQWRNTKSSLKKKESDHRNAIKATGGGPPPPSPSIPPEDAEIMALIPNEFIVDVNIYDSDSISNTQMKYKNDKRNKNENDKSFTVSKSEDPLEGSSQMNLTPNFSSEAEPNSGNTKDYKSTETAQEYPSSKPAKFKQGQKRKKIDTNYEQELFLQMKKNKTEEHKMRMAIMAIEKEYWLQKLKNEKH